MRILLQFKKGRRESKATMIMMNKTDESTALIRLQL